MPWILMLFRTLLLPEVFKPLLARLLVYLGMTVVSYTGFSVLWTVVSSAIETQWSSLPVNVIAYLTIAKVPNALSVVLSAYTAKITMKGLTAAGTLKQVLWKPYQQGALFPGT